MICPHCRKETVNGMSVNFIEKLIWARCSCGVIFQEEIKDRELSSEYIDAYKGRKFYVPSAEYPVKIYFPIIEDMIYGRRLLEVDPLDFSVSELAAKRGWVTFATAKALEAENTHVYKDSFDNIDEVPEIKFDCIFAYHIVEKKASGEILKKFHSWLNPGGVLFIATPDTQFVDELGVLNFGHWFKENNILFSKQAFSLELKKAGFDPILIRANSSNRFIKTNDMHVIARRGM